VQNNDTCSNVRQGRLIRLAIQPPRVRVSRTFVNLRIMSSTSVRLSVIHSKVQKKHQAEEINRPPPARTIHYQLSIT